MTGRVPSWPCQGRSSGECQHESCRPRTDEPNEIAVRSAEPGPSQAMCELRYEGNECHRPEGHSGLCYDERTRVAFEDGWWGDDKGNSGRGLSVEDRATEFVVGALGNLAQTCREAASLGSIDPGYAETAALFEQMFRDGRLVVRVVG